MRSTGISQTCQADEPAAKSGDSGPFVSTVLPFLQKHCVRCHSGDQPKAELRLDRFRESRIVEADQEVWRSTLKMLSDGEMPPEGEPQPAADESQAVMRALEAELARFDCGGVPRPGRVTLRRLNRVEYNNTVRDLIGIDFRPADEFPADDVGYGFDNIGDVLSIPPVLFEKYLNASERIIDRAFRDAAARKRILPAETLEDGFLESDGFRRQFEDFVLRAFRRPPTSDEVDRLLKLSRLARDTGGTPEEAVRAAFVAALTSPHFLFRVELDPPADDPDGIRQLNDYEIATRLSYFLWSTMPDGELFDLARKNELHRPDVLDSQVQRMLGDGKSQALVKNFAGQWLQLRDLKHMTPDPERFPDFDEELRLAMQNETERFFESIVHEDRSILDFLNADYSFVNERLARHYGLPDVQGKEFRRVTLSEQRRGVLTHGSILLLTSNPTRTSPVKRGKWILENILADPPPPPPGAVPELDENAELLGSLRERMEQHRANEACAVCHRQMDTLGFGLENFDAIGAWRERDGTAEIDASGSLPGDKKFRGPKELMTILADQKGPDFARCLTEKLLTYALGRGLHYYDRCAVDDILKQIGQNNYRFVVLVQAIAKSEPFLLREVKRGE